MPDISTPNLDYGNMVQAWDINDALMGGTLYMRQLGEACGISVGAAIVAAV